MEYTVKLNQQEMQTILMALGELPLKLSINVFAKLQKAQQTQDAAQAVPIEELAKQINATGG